MTQQRLSLSSMIAAAAAVAALGLPGMASATYEHPANSEQGVIVHPEHFKSEKTRAQVKAKAKDAMWQGRLSYSESNTRSERPMQVLARRVSKWATNCEICARN